MIKRINQTHNTMNKILLIALATLLWSCSGQEGYKIRGVITGEEITDGKAYLANLARAETFTDTTDLINGKFIFKGKVETPENYIITVEGITGRILFFLDNSNISIEATAEDFSKATVTGGVTNDLIVKLNKEKAEISKKYDIDNLLEEFYKEETSQERKDEILEVYEEARKESKILDSLFFANNPNSFYTISQLIQQVEEHPVEEMEAKVQKYQALKQFKGNRYLNDLTNAVNTLKTLQPGMQAPEFTLNDPDGNPVSLSSVYSQHEITMIDFWAGWCGPCRRFNPTLVKIYDKFKDSGFGIIGVSLDNSKELWTRAIEEDKLTWVQVSDLEYWNSAAAQLYYVRLIPQNIFVDRDGKIVKRRVDKDEIEGFLTEFLGL